MGATNRIVGLDALRGVAALTVALTHFTSTYYVIYKQQPVAPIDLGAPAVAMFFIISGFVILMTLDRSKTVTDFAISRFSRLYPVFWVSILLTFIVVHVANLPGRQTSALVAVVNTTMLPSVFGMPAVDVVYWSLTVEVFFYMIAGSIFALGRRRWLVPILSCLMIAGVADAFWPISRLRGGYRIEDMLILRWWPLFLFGITFYQMRSGIRRRHVLVILLCAACSLITDWRVGMVNCALAATVFCATRYDLPIFSNKILVYLGAISYSFYLIHCNVGYCIIRALLQAGIGQLGAAAIALTATIALASALCFLVERPSNRYVRARLSRMFRQTGSRIVQVAAAPN